MKMKRTTKILLIILAAALLIAAVCAMMPGRNDGSAQDTEQTAAQPSAPDTRPALVVERTRAKTGERRVEVIVEVKNNPGILGIVFDLFYDDSVMTLVEAQSELDLDGCVYTSPAYFRNPTTFLWDFQDANWTEDGTFLKLYFDLSETAPAGEYPIKIMYSYGNIFDANFDSIDVGVENGYIFITE